MGKRRRKKPRAISKKAARLQTLIGNRRRRILEILDQLNKEKP